MQGFKTYDDCMTNVELNRRDLGVRLGEETTNSALQWLDSAEENNFFIFLHYFDVHGPYINKPPFNSLFVDDDFYGKPIWLEKVVPDTCAYDGIPSYQVLQKKEKNDGGSSEYEKNANFYRAQYDGGIKYVVRGPSSPCSSSRRNTRATTLGTRPSRSATSTGAIRSSRARSPCAMSSARARPARKAASMASVSADRGPRLFSTLPRRR